MAVNFDGLDDYVEGNLVTNSNLYTFSFWTNPTSTSASWPTLLGLRPTSGSGYIWLYYYSRTGLVALQYRNSAGATATAIGSGTTLNFNTWNHIAVTFNSATGLVEFYKNGSFAAKSQLPITGNGVFDYFVIGDKFKGMIDEARIYKRALTAQEVAAHYNSGKGQNGVPETGLLAGWHFNESTGNTAADYSANGNTGILKNGVSWVNGTIIP
jgi:hypothetical protein